MRPPSHSTPLSLPNLGGQHLSPHPHFDHYKRLVDAQRNIAHLSQPPQTPLSFFYHNSLSNTYTRINKQKIDICARAHNTCEEDKKRGRRGGLIFRPSKNRKLANIHITYIQICSFFRKRVKSAICKVIEKDSSSAMTEEAKNEQTLVESPSEDILNSNSESLASKADNVLEAKDKVVSVEGFVKTVDPDGPSLPPEQSVAISAGKTIEAGPKIDSTEVASVHGTISLPLEQFVVSLPEKTSEVGPRMNGNEETSVDGPSSLPLEQFVATSPEKTSEIGTNVDSTEVTSADGPTILPPEQLVSSPEKTSEVGPRIDGIEVTSVDGHTSLPLERGNSSPEKTSKVVATIKGTTVTSAEVRDIGTSSCEGVDIGKDASSGLESGTSVTSSLDKPEVQVDGCMVAAMEAGQVNLPDLDESTHVKNKDSNGFETNAPTNIEPLQKCDDSSVSIKLEIGESTNVNSKESDGLETNAPMNNVPVQASDDGVVVAIKQEAHEEKPQHIVPSQSSTWQHKTNYVPTAKPQATSNSTAEVKQVKVYSGLVDTAAPFESVKEAVSRFGGIVDWKAHKAQTMKRREFVQLELQKAQEEIPVYKKQAKEAGEAKGKIVRELQDTKRLIEELKLNLEKIQTEEAQAKQDSELAQLRVKELEQGIAGEASVAIKTQVDVSKKRHTAAVAELDSVRAELKTLREEHAILIVERENAIKRAEEAVSASSNIEKTVEDLTLELLTAREALEAAHAVHMEAEEHRIGAALARDQDSLTWEKELKQAEDELKQLNEKLLSMKDLQSKLDTASALLLNLKSELAAYMEAKLNEESEGLMEEKATSESEDEVKTHADVQATVASVKKEIEEVKTDIEKAKEKVEILKVAAVSLQSQLETEKAALASMQQREGMASIAVSSLEAEVNRTRAEIEAIQAKEKEAREQMLELPKALQKAAREAEAAKSAAQSAQEELRKAKEEEEQVKASASTLHSRLNASLKEIEVAKVSEKLALSAVKALQESEQAAAMGLDDGADNWVTLPLDEYYALSKRAHVAEEEANEKVAAAFSQIELAKESESISLRRLEEVQEKLVERKEALRLATEKAEVAKQGKLAVEQELRKWRADNVQRRKANAVNPPKSPQRSFDETRSFVISQEALDATQPEPSTRLYGSESNADVKVKKKKASLLPKIVMFLARRKN